MYLVNTGQISYAVVFTCIKMMAVPIVEAGWFKVIKAITAEHSSIHMT